MSFENPTFNATASNGMPSFDECVAMFQRGQKSPTSRLNALYAELRVKARKEKAASLAAQKAQSLQSAATSQSVALAGRDEKMSEKNANLGWEKAVLHKPSNEIREQDEASHGAQKAEMKIQSELERTRFEARLKEERKEKQRQARADFFLLRHALALV